MGEIKMVVGLGNRGEEYVDTRHNVGFMVIDSLAELLQIDIRKRKFSARLGEVEFVGKKLILLKPWQFMNRSGRAVVKAVDFYKLGVGDLLVVVDDMSLEPGRIRVRSKGSAGGHNGLSDVIERLGTESIGRLRIGIGQRWPQDVNSRSGKEASIDPSASRLRLAPPRRALRASFVLDRPTETERPLLDEAIERSRDAVLCWVEYGIEAAMNNFNSA